MAGNYLIYSQGILNQFSTHSVAHVTTVATTVATATLTSGGAHVNASSPTGSVYAAYKDLWERLNDGQVGLIPSLTTTQIAALSGVDDGVQVINQTIGRLDVCVGGTFISAAGDGTMLAAAFGEMIEDNATGSPINSTSKLWDTAGAGVLDANTLITFASGTNDDHLLVGANGAGTYTIHFSCTFTNAGGNVTEAGIHVNGTQVGKMEDTHAGDSAEHRDLRGYGFLDLVASDQITLHVVSATPADVVTVYHAHVAIKRIT